MPRVPLKQRSAIAVVVKRPAKPLNAVDIVVQRILGENNPVLNRIPGSLFTKDSTVFSTKPKLSLPSSSNLNATASELEQLDDDDDAFSPLPSDCIIMETPVRPIPGSNSAKAPSSKRQFTYDPDTYLNVNAPSKKSKKSDKEPSLSESGQS